MAQDKRPELVRAFIGTPPTWLILQSPLSIEPIPMLHQGEASSISLALEVHADLLLIDETLGRKAAVARGINIAGTIGIVQRAADQHMLDLQEVFDRIKNTDFWISHELLDARLKLLLQRRK